MVKHTRKNKLGGKKMRNKKVSSRKYKKGGNIFGSDRKSIKVKLYNRYIPDPFGQDAVLNIGDKITGTINFGDQAKEGVFKFNGYNNGILYVQLLGYNSDGEFLVAHTSREYPKSPKEFHEQFYTQEDKKINLIDQTNIKTITVGGKRRTLKTLKKSKKVKKSRKNRK